MKLAALMLVAILVGAPTPARAAGTETIPAFEGGIPTFDVLATAYTSGPESTGKQPGHPQYGLTFTGTLAQQGETIAVDPQQIPLGSLVYIEELGEYRVAEDTGGAIRGNRIDLYMEKVSDALDWGMRKVRVRVFPRI
jgi:3D (Asp-Asp-Asp) domain-containing protein